MATRKVNRKSTKQEVKINLGWVGKGRERVAIDFSGTELDSSQRKKDGYNAQLVFARKFDKSGPWVEVVDRQAINSAEESFPNVSKSVFYGMAVWACAILNTTRVLVQDGRLVTVPSKMILWDVYWVADDGHHLQGQVKAQSESYACDRMAQLEVMRDNMYAMPAKRERTVVIHS